MVSPYPPPQQPPPRPNRRRAARWPDHAAVVGRWLVRGTVVVLLVVGGIIGFRELRETLDAGVFDSEKIDVGQGTVQVLNGGEIDGLAGRITNQLSELGYETASPGNADATPVTSVRFDRADRELAESVAVDLGLAPARLREQTFTLKLEDTPAVVVTLGADYQPAANVNQ